MWTHHTDQFFFFSHINVFEISSGWLQQLPMDWRTFWKKNTNQFHLSFPWIIDHQPLCQLSRNSLKAPYTTRNLTFVFHCLHSIEKHDRHGNVVRKLKFADKYIKGVDRNDKMIGTFSCLWKSMKWTKKWLSISLKKGPCMLTFYKQGSRKPLLRFKLDCINVLLTATATEPSALAPPGVVCTKTKKESKYHCGDCAHKPGLCPAPCFKIYHTEWDWTLKMNYILFMYLIICN